ncbi:ABC transporter permease [Hydrogenothermus marinus]|uniref:Putative ABC transport system permease protein n=1 Tax=Hydrogenothermus marinus TaxID=133270 RepID=A0A3M0BRJ4_9AQUI|nr:iron export ABC transporter permease subunit FetB [Hydrogenothermus marinus]RMA97115.1 putative ABC transport system permease protein [Hydrogenothermus marinus]
MEYKFLVSYVLILIALYYSYREKLGIEKTILINSLRAFIQLLILGYALVYIFKLKHPIELIFILFLMILFASYTAQNRVNLKEKGFLVAFLSIFFSSSLVIASLLVLQIISFKPNELIPVGGMVIGNSLNVYSLTVDRLKGEIKNNIDLIENFIAIGATLKNALYEMKKASVKAALIPTLNNLQTVGIIHIPGITTGMLLAGAEPLKAVSYQLAIMYMMVAVALFTAVITINIGYRKIFVSVFS